MLDNRVKNTRQGSGAHFRDILNIRGKYQIKPELLFSPSGGVMELFAKATSIRMAVKFLLLPIMKIPGGAYVTARQRLAGAAGKRLNPVQV